MTDLFIDFDIIQHKKPLNNQSGMVPYRDYELVEFYKKVKEKYVIDAISIDLENHAIEFIIGGPIQISEVKTQ